ncbi:MAG TPA: MCE family protein [Streptosporangiaceae bacterium]|nr:MCE family protein [Streptosporangiaceae bacterium]
MARSDDSERHAAAFGMKRRGRRGRGAAARGWRRPRWPRLRTWRERLVFGIGVAILAAGLAAGGVLVYGATHPTKQVTAYFREAIGIYPGSTVRVLGVSIGSVDAVQPEGTQVKVTMTLGAGQPVPAGVRAVVVSSSVVADRYVQLTPAYTGGPQIADGATIPISRTAVPVEVDQIYASLGKLSAALGPNGVNKHGALSNLIRSGAANLAGNGGYLHNMIAQFSGLSKTLGGSAGNLYATIAYLEQFTAMLKANNGQVALAEQQLNSVFSFLAADRQDLGGALNQLATALGQVQTFVGDNRALIKSNVTKLASITHILVRERASLAETLDVAPLAVDNLVNAYDATTRTINGRGDLNELSMGKAARQLGAGAQSVTGAGTSGPAGAVPLPLSKLPTLPPLPLPAVGLYGTPQAALAGGH